MFTRETIRAHRQLKDPVGKASCLVKRSNYYATMTAWYQRPYQRPRPYKPPPPISRTRTTMTRIVVISMCSSCSGVTFHAPYDDFNYMERFGSPFVPYYLLVGPINYDKK